MRDTAVRFRLPHKKGFCYRGTDRRDGIPIRLSPGASTGRPECSRLSALLRPGQQLAEVTAVAEHQVADDDQAPAIPQRLESQIDRAARTWGVHAHSKNQLRYKISRPSLQPVA